MNENSIDLLEKESSLEARQSLESFSRLANKSTLAGHPRDEERWFRFLCLAHKANKQMDVDLVIKSLEDLRWSNDDAYRLGLQFEFSQSLLSFIDE